MNRGYKALSLDMKPIYGDKNMTYELNKIYEMEESILRVCRRGYHYYKKLEDIWIPYIFDTSKNRIFEVEILGKEVTNDDIKYCTNKIKLVKELTQDESNQYIKEYIEDHLDTLIYDENYIVRMAVAKQGYGLDILVDDNNVDVRKEAIKMISIMKGRNVL